MPASSIQNKRYVAPITFLWDEPFYIGAIPWISADRNHSCSIEYEDFVPQLTYCQERALYYIFYYGTQSFAQNVRTLCFAHMYQYATKYAWHLEFLWCLPSNQEVLELMEVGSEHDTVSTPKRPTSRI
jgi:hypothetical protein